MRNLCKALRRLCSARDAAIAPTFALMIIPLLGMVGFAIDVSMMLATKARAQNIVDGGAVNFVRSIVTGMEASGTTVADFNSNVASSKTSTQSFMAGLISADTALASYSPTPTVNATYDSTSNTVTVTTSVTYVFQTSFMAIFGVSTVNFTVSANATQTLQKYFSFYLMLDMSGSMSLPSTESEQARLAAVNPDFKSEYPGGYVFACHFSGYSGYQLSRNGGNWSNPQVTSCPTAGTSACIQLRTDAVGTAITQLLSTAASSETIVNQYQIGLYPFIAYLQNYYPLTSNITATDTSSLSYAAANISSLLDTGVNASLGSGGTHFENAFPTLNSLITSVGDGSQGNPLPFVFLVTDGSQDNQYQWNGSWWGSNQATTINPAACTQLKNRGITISILYIPYQTIENPTSFAGGEDYAANANIPYAPAALTSCASSGYFYTANTPADISNALAAMFNQAISIPRISQ